MTFSDQKGFTVLEMVIVVALFAMAITMTLSIFSLAQRTQKKTSALQRLQQDARYLVNKMASDVRVGEIDYAKYPPAGANPLGESVLSLRDFEGKSLQFKKSDPSDTFCNGTPSQSVCSGTKACLVFNIDNVCAAATAPDLNLLNLTFFISPETADNVVKQPKVRMLVAASSQLKGQREPSVINLQTTISSRQYAR